MKELLISNCEKKYIFKCLESFIRLDGRAFDEFRKLKIDFGRDWGCCHISLGQTRVLAQVSCEIVQPKSSRPNEGVININVELNPMGAVQFEAGRQSELSVHLNRMLEKCLKDSRAVDLESLCIKLNEKVWALRVDLNVLNNEGNILDCASIAALTALAHFRRPDVTSDGESIIVHTYKERDPIPTVIHHYPIIITYAVFNQSATPLADPSLLEEGVSEAQLSFAINSFKEICSLHLGGKSLTNQQIILECASKAAGRACSVVQQIKQSIEEDIENRKNHKKVFFQHYLLPQNEDELKTDYLSLVLNKWNLNRKDRKKKVKTESNKEVEQFSPSKDNICEKTVILLGEGSAALLSSKDKNQMDTSSSSDSDVEIVETKADNIVIDNSSEEET